MPVTAKKKPASTWRRNLVRGLALLVLAALAAGAWLYFDYRRFADTTLTLQSHELTVEVPLGTPFNSIVRQLERKRLTRAPRFYWRLLADEMGVTKGLHAGEYAVFPGLTPRQLLARMAAGDVLQHRFTIIEGWTFRELRAALGRDTRLRQTLPGMDDDAIMQRLDAAKQHPEGRFLPETYAFIKNAADIDILRQAHAALILELQRAWKRRAADLPLNTPDEVLILASIIEKETGQASERREIAGVFARRLKLGMKLQTDPTVIYGLGPTFNGNLTRRDMQADTPYNTYTRAGLPPTPIALAGKDSLHAAVDPDDGDSLYFVGRGDGFHQFSATFAQHLRAVAKYQLGRP